MSSDLVNRLRGYYAVGPIQENGEPKYGYRKVNTTPLKGMAADRIEFLEEQLEAYRAVATALQRELGRNWE